MRYNIKKLLAMVSGTAAALLFLTGTPAHAIDGGNVHMEEQMECCCMDMPKSHKDCCEDMADCMQRMMHQTDDPWIEAEMLRMHHQMLRAQASGESCCPAKTN
ncbi:hypothetical protein [Haloglycomyces albus]|uniref:hypothetical protein n=1 Tax=Haloglycomyces albus TaxID=526067 RepID=UPI00046D65D2|nr:hypothetical protein [Haloglycomyces albus]